MVASRKVQNGSTQEHELPSRSPGRSDAAVPRKYRNSTNQYQTRAVTCARQIFLIEREGFPDSTIASRSLCRGQSDLNYFTEL
jgi:hypothetical protein